MSDYHIFLDYTNRYLKEDGPAEFVDGEQRGGFGTQEIDQLYLQAMQLARRHNLRFAGIRYHLDGLLQFCNMRNRIEGFEFHSNSLDDILAFKQEALETKVGVMPLVDKIEVRDYRGQSEGYVKF